MHMLKSCFLEAMKGFTEIHFMHSQKHMQTWFYVSQKAERSQNNRHFLKKRWPWWNLHSQISYGKYR